MKLLTLAILFLSTLSFASTESDLELLKKRIEELEKQQELLLSSSVEPRNNVNSFLNDNLTLGGFFESGYDFITGKDTDTQAGNSFNALGLNVAADFGNKYRFVGQFVHTLPVPLRNEHNDPSGTPDEREYTQYVPLSVLTQGYLEYSKSRKLNIQGGIGFTPFGYALQLREPVLYVRSRGPQLVRNSVLLSPFWSGVHIYGYDEIGNKNVGYDLYTLTPVEQLKTMGAGGRLWGSNQNETIIAGISGQVGRNDDEAVEVVGADVRFDVYPFQIRSEFSQEIAKRSSDTWTGYLEPGYFIYEEELLLYTFADYLYSPQNETNGIIKDPIQKWEYGLGLNWLPTSYTRIRAGFTYSDYVGNRSRIGGKERDYVGMNISAGVAF